MVAFFTLATVMSTQADHHKKSEKVLRHVVCFKFKESASEKDIEKIVKAFGDLQKKIPEIKDFEWGTNNSPEKHDKGFTHCFILTFDSEAGRAVYLPHEDHKAFGKMPKAAHADLASSDGGAPSRHFTVDSKRSFVARAFAPVQASLELLLPIILPEQTMTLLYVMKENIQLWLLVTPMADN